MTATAFKQAKNTVNVEQRVAGISMVALSIDPSLLPTYPAGSSGDYIEFFDLPIGARILGGWIQVNQSVGAGSSTLTLQCVQNGTATSLTSALAATTAGGNLMNAVPPLVSTFITTIRALAGTASLNAQGLIEVVVFYSL